jgi:uncharacterized DUF497 family protein
MPTFEWDPEKNKKNLSKHNVDFREAQEIFDDKNAIERLGTFRDAPKRSRIGLEAAKNLVSVHGA